MKRAKMTAVSVVALAAFCGLLYQQTIAQSAGDAKAEVGKAAPDFKLKDIFGKEFTLSEFKGKIVVLEWVNQECPVTRRVHDQKIVPETYAKYAEKGVVWLGIDTTAGMTPERNRVYAAQRGLAFPILHDTDGKVGRTYGAQTTPHMYVIDKDGKLVYNGAIDDDQQGQDKDGRTCYVGNAIEALLKGEEVQPNRTRPYGCTVKYPA